MSRREVGGHDSARFFIVEFGETDFSAVLVADTGRDLKVVAEEGTEVGDPSLRNRVITEVGFDPVFADFGSDSVEVVLGMNRAAAVLVRDTGLSKDL